MVLAALWLGLVALVAGHGNWWTLPPGVGVMLAVVILMIGIIFSWGKMDGVPRGFPWINPYVLVLIMSVTILLRFVRLSPVLFTMFLFAAVPAGAILLAMYWLRDKPPSEKDTANGPQDYTPNRSRPE